MVLAIGEGDAGSGVVHPGASGCTGPRRCPLGSNPCCPAPHPDVTAVPHLWTTTHHANGHVHVSTQKLAQDVLDCQKPLHCSISYCCTVLLRVSHGAQFMQP